MKIKLTFSVVAYVVTRVKKVEFLFALFSLIILILGTFSHFVPESRWTVYAIGIIVAIELGIQCVEFFKLGKPRFDDVEIVQSTTIPLAEGESEVSIYDLLPQQLGSEREFKSVRPSQASEEVIFVDPILDAQLSSRMEIALFVKASFEKRILSALELHGDDLCDYLAVFAKQQSSASLFNERKIGVASAIGAGMNSLNIGRTSYFTSILTNEACTRRLVRKEENSLVKDFRALFPIARDNSGGIPKIAMAPLEASRMSNHIGVSTLAMTRDGYLIWWVQKETAQQSQGKIVPSGSGSLNWSDFTGLKEAYLEGLLRQGMARELCEECSLSNSTTIEKIADATRVLGYFRWVKRGGKPEFIGISRLSVDRGDVQPQNRELERETALAKDQWQQVRSVADVLDVCNAQLRSSREVATPLAALFLRLKQILEDNDSLVRKPIVELWNLSDNVMRSERQLGDA